MKDKLQVMDLFAGAGGLSNGFEQTNMFEVKVAVEINKNARKTYQLNHHPDIILHEDITSLKFKKDDGTLHDDYSDIDVIIGGPPCQGFSNANRQKNTLLSSNNQLVKEYLRAIEEVKPKAFVMENVRTLESEKHKFFINDDDEKELAELEVKVEDEFIKLGNLPNNSENLISFLMKASQNKDNLNPYLINKEVFAKMNSLLRHVKKQEVKELADFLNRGNNKNYFSKILDSKWQHIHKEYWDETYKNKWNVIGEYLKKILANVEVNIQDVINILEDIIETQRIMNKISEVIQNKIKLFGINVVSNSVEIHIKSYNVFRYIKAKFSSFGYELNDDKYIFNAARYGVPQERRRLILIGVLKEKLKSAKVKTPKPIFEEIKDEYYKIHHAIADLEQLEPATNVYDDEINRGEISSIIDNPLIEYLNNNTKIVYNHIRTESREMAQKRFKALTAGQNFHNLDESLKSTYSDHSRTQNTIYKRLDYNQPSDTVVNVRKSMWIHPKLNRAISIREAARLQSFQDSYKFLGTKDSQYQQVGNAVPPLMARFVAESLLESLGFEVDEKIKDIILNLNNVSPTIIN